MAQSNALSNESAGFSVGGIMVRQKEQLYCLNDLHKASGGEDKKKPVHFLKTDQVKDLVITIKGRDSYLLNPLKITKGRNGGTYACKQIVYAYAMWISAEFHLNVIDAYDALVNGEIERARQMASRTILKDEFIPMTDAIQQHRLEQGKQVKGYHFSNEADMINRIMTGMTAKKFKTEFQCESVRDNLSHYGRKAMISLQRANTSMIEMDEAFQARKQKLSELLMCKWNKEPLINNGLSHQQK